MQKRYRRGSKGKIVWTEADQREAVYNHGVFLARHEWYRDRVWNHVVLKGWLTIEDIARRAFQCDPFFEKMEAFIRQQKRFGWSGGWEGRCGDEEAFHRRAKLELWRQRGLWPAHKPSRKTILQAARLAALPRSPDERYEVDLALRRARSLREDQERLARAPKTQPPKQ